MRGSESVAARSHHLFARQPLPPSHPHPPIGGSLSYKSSSHLEPTSSGAHADARLISGSTVPQSRRTTAAATTEQYTPNKRYLDSEVSKDSGNDIISRPPKMKVTKSRSDGAAMEAKYSSQPYYGSLPKRTKAVKKEKSEKLSVSKLPKSDSSSSKVLLGRRSRTFVVESQKRWLGQPLESRAQRTGVSDVSGTSRNKLGANRKTNKTPGYADNEQRAFTKRRIPKGKASLMESTSRGSHQWQEEHFDQWDESGESLREGARNPFSPCGLPVRPKSAGQLRYFDSEDSDESSMDGEIEIVDIDKELENDNEPSPYWSEVPPFQVPNIFVQANFSSNEGINLQSDYHQQEPEQAVPQRLQQPLPRQRRNSGESDLSAFSDTFVKTVSGKGRRRFMSEPEILNLEQHRLLNRKSEIPKRGSVIQEEPRFIDADGVGPTYSVNPRVSREKLYSDTMERMLSRYSEMGLREQQRSFSVSEKGRASRIPVGNGVTAYSRVSPPGQAVPPRKLKPILKQPRSDATNSSTSS